MSTAETWLRFVVYEKESETQRGTRQVHASDWLGMRKVRIQDIDSRETGPLMMWPGDGTKNNQKHRQHRDKSMDQIG